MNIVSFHKRGLQLVIQYFSIARITRSSEELRFFSANPILLHHVLPIICEFQAHEFNLFTYHSFHVSGSGGGATSRFVV